MFMSHTHGISQSSALTWSLLAIALLSGGCASENVLYNKDRKTVSNVWEGNLGENRGIVPCNGSIEVDYHGDFYGIYFKSNAVPQRDFYFTTAKDYSYSSLPLKIIPARGVVKFTGERQVVFDVEYKDADGNWTKLPFNGRHKIDEIWPDEIPKTRNDSL
jgi:hypothetical protein